MRRGRIARSVQLAVLAGGTVVGVSWQAKAETAFDPQTVAVNIQRTPAQSWPGYGIYMGDGLVVTAAHVAGHALLTRPSVVVKGQPLPTESVKEGSYPDNDLTVLRLTPPLPAELAPLHVTLCAEPPKPGEAVKVATPEKVTNSAVISPDILPPDMRTRYAASIKDVYTTGNSGSGVFDAASRCLLGIMSSKIEQQLHLIVNGSPTVRTVGLAKHFVPASDIKLFMDGLAKP